MATVKIGTLLIRTLAKPISTRIKTQAREHERFRNLCVSLAQTLYRYEVRLRTGLLGEAPTARHLRPLSETRAIENGANFLAEGFLFAVAAALVVGEGWRSSRSETRRRADVGDALESLQVRVGELAERLERWEDASAEERERSRELARILDRVVDIGLRGGWAELQDTPLQIPRIQLNIPRLASTESEPSPSSTESNTKLDSQ
ncbi:optic atrophy 3 protein-domain-containing protein [Lactarius akahatsu]|uniref:Optic atrophy 3 protein-domain-containing protein n=1 Tax=Lactarius akahatsu TaxID=416441 RepID=A0AAD4QDX7_9AGAM|nr:optic atrophy 3 protein-domain-containing protein [Lactarius akahatsu]